MQHEYDAQRADQTHTEPENQRHGEGELGQENDGVEDIEIGKIDLRHQLAMERECGALAHLLGPILQAT